MQPLLTATSEEPCSSRGSVGKINLQRQNPRRKKGIKKSGTKKPKPQTFQKKVVVFKYMGVRAPCTFTRREDNILFRGLLPELSVEASELEIRSAIVKILHNNRSFHLEDFDVNDFEFMDVHGKKVTVPTCEDNHQFTGKSIK